MSRPTISTMNFDARRGLLRKASSRLSAASARSGSSIYSDPLRQAGVGEDGRLNAFLLLTGPALGLVKKNAVDYETAEALIAANLQAAQRAVRYSVALAPLPLRRRSFDIGELRSERPPLVMFHELRSYFDPQYRLFLIKRQLLATIRARDVGVVEMFDLVDADGTGAFYYTFPIRFP
ncbi:hypothetical protein M885DRAFT_35234 [Pelagophyceae sp. CCMP2097]|nr:hypothetical protein M885DRAFT_35234 [Pelagophyceae sp. CCMP2097]